MLYHVHHQLDELSKQFTDFNITNRVDQLGDISNYDDFFFSFIISFKGEDMELFNIWVDWQGDYCRLHNNNQPEMDTPIISVPDKIAPWIEQLLGSDMIVSLFSKIFNHEQ